MDQLEASRLLRRSMHEYCDDINSADLANVVPLSRDVCGRNGMLYAIEVSATAQSDGRTLVMGNVRDHNPNNLTVLEDQFFC